MRLALISAASCALALASAGATEGFVASGGPAAAGCSGESRVGSHKLAYAAIVRKPLTAYRSPGKHAFAHFRLRNVNGVSTVFSIRTAVFDESCKPIWFRAQLPVRPNGVVGYVRANRVAVVSVRTRLRVDLSARRLTYLRDGRRVRRFRVSIGSPRTPTPVGHFYVNQEIRAADPTGPWGPSAIGISAFSPVLTDWVQGGPIAVHGTNRPDLIGRAVSTGCVRVRNDLERWLFARIPLGTPVDIRR